MSETIDSNLHALALLPADKAELVLTAANDVFRLERCCGGGTWAADERTREETALPTAAPLPRSSRAVLCLVFSSIVQFFHVSVDRLLGHNVPSLSSLSLSAPDATAATASCQFLARSAVSMQLNTSEKLLKFLSPSSVPPAVQQSLCAGVLGRWSELKAYFGGAAVSTGELALKDFDWQVRLVLASDKIANMKEARCLLSLKVQPENRLNTSALNVSADREQLVKQQADAAAMDAAAAATASAEDVRHLNFELNEHQLDRMLQRFAEINGVLQQIKQ
jgi:hypothetical protein